MNYLYYLLLFMFAGPLIRSINYYIPGFSSLVYWGFIIYIFYSSYKNSRNFQRAQYRGYSTNYAGRQGSQNYSQSTQNTSKASDSRVKSDVIDVEFSEREVE